MDLDAHASLIDAVRADPRSHAIRCSRRGAIREPGAGVRAKRISKQNLAQPELRCRRCAAAQTHTGVLRLLRLAFVGARTLAARAAGAHVSRRAVHATRTRGAEEIADARKHCAGSGVSARRRASELRAAVRPRLAAAARCGATRIGPGAFREFASARTGRK